MVGALVSDLIRGLTLGIVGISQVIDVIYRAIFGLVFIQIASRRLGKMLIK